MRGEDKRIGEMGVQAVVVSYWEMGKYFCPNLFLKILTKEAVTTDAYSSGSQSSQKRVIPSSGDGSYLGVPS